MTEFSDTIYIHFGNCLNDIASDWNDDARHYRQNPGTVDRYQEIVSAAYAECIDNNDSLPSHWQKAGGVRDGMGVFCAISFMKAATLGFSGGDRGRLEEYMLSNDGLQYASKLGSVPSLVAGRTEVDLALSGHVYSNPADFMVTSRTIQMVAGKMDIPSFEDVRAKHIDAAIRKGKDLDVKCQALMHKAFPTIFRAVNLLGVNSGIAESVYDRFASLRQNT